ncbi:hypothetical protein JCM33374_g661 [Metschnikowia sp. JCM 33374]|nr:hypothetical protein JCM33374_g661 [Metschnikowia sp. JCM 33374]
MIVSFMIQLAFLLLMVGAARTRTTYATANMSTGNECDHLEKSERHIHVGYIGKEDRPHHRKHQASTILRWFQEWLLEFKNRNSFKAEVGEVVGFMWVGSVVENSRFSRNVIAAFITDIETNGMPLQIYYEFITPEISKNYGIILTTKGLAHAQEFARKWSAGQILRNEDGYRSSSKLSVCYLPYKTRKWASNDDEAGKCDTRIIKAGENPIGNMDDSKVFNPTLDFSRLLPGQPYCYTLGSPPDLRPLPNADGTCVLHKVVEGDTCASLGAKYWPLKLSDIDHYNQETYSWKGCETVQQNEVICISKGRNQIARPESNPNAECGPLAPHELFNTECPNKACCNDFGYCGVTSQFCEVKNPGASVGKRGCYSNCGYAKLPTRKARDFRMVTYWMDTEGPLNMNITEETSMNSWGDSKYYDVVHYAFATINEDMSISIGKDFKEFKKIEPQKVVSFGGWDFSSNPNIHMRFRKAVSPQYRGTFAKNVVEFMQRHDLTGVDFCWKYPEAGDGPKNTPGEKGDGMRYAESLKIIKDMDKSRTVSVAIPVEYRYSRYFPLAKLGATVDYFGMMNYDYVGQWDYGKPNTGIGCHTNVSVTEEGIKMLVKSGIDTTKVYGGVANYGRVYRLADPQCKHYKCPFIGPESPVPHGRITQTAGLSSMNEIDQSGVSVLDRDSSFCHYGTFNNGSDWVAWMSESDILETQRWYESIGLGGSILWMYNFYKTESEDEAYSEAYVSGESGANRNANDDHQVGQLSKLGNSTLVLNVTEVVPSRVTVTGDPGFMVSENSDSDATENVKFNATESIEKNTRVLESSGTEEPELRTPKELEDHVTEDSEYATIISPEQTVTDKSGYESTEQPGDFETRQTPHFLKESPEYTTQDSPKTSGSAQPKYEVSETSAIIIDNSETSSVQPPISHLPTEKENTAAGRNFDGNLSDFIVTDKSTYKPHEEARLGAPHTGGIPGYNEDIALKFVGTETVAHNLDAANTEPTLAGAFELDLPENEYLKMQNIRYLQSYMDMIIERLNVNTKQAVLIQNVKTCTSRLFQQSDSSNYTTQERYDSVAITYMLASNSDGLKSPGFSVAMRRLDEANYSLQRYYDLCPAGFLEHMSEFRHQLVPALAMLYTKSEVEEPHLYEVLINTQGGILIGGYTGTIYGTEVLSHFDRFRNQQAQAISDDDSGDVDYIPERAFDPEHLFPYSIGTEAYEKTFESFPENYIMDNLHVLCSYLYEVDYDDCSGRSDSIRYEISHTPFLVDDANAQEGVSARPSYVVNMDGNSPGSACNAMLYLLSEEGMRHATKNGVPVLTRAASKSPTFLRRYSTCTGLPDWQKDDYPPSSTQEGVVAWQNYHNYTSRVSCIRSADRYLEEKQSEMFYAGYTEPVSSMGLPNIDPEIPMGSDGPMRQPLEEGEKFYVAVNIGSDVDCSDHLKMPRVKTPDGYGPASGIVSMKAV